MRSLADQAQVVAELHSLRNELANDLTTIRNRMSRIDRLIGYYEGIPRTRLTVAPDLESEPVEAVPEPPEPLDDEEPREERPYSVSRLHGKMFYEHIERKAEALGAFTAREFAQALGLGTGDAMTWLTQLVSNEVLSYASGTYTTTTPPTLHIWVVNNEETEFDLAKAAEVTRQAEEDAQEEIDDLLARKIITTVNGSGVYIYERPGRHHSPNHHPHRAPPEKDRPCYEDAPPRGEPVRIRKATRRQRSVAGAGGIKGPKQRERRYQEAQQAKERRAAEQSARDKAQYGGSGDKNSSRKARRKASKPVD